MKIRFNKYVEIVFVWFAIAGTIGRAWIIPDISWQKQVLLLGASFIVLNGIWVIHYMINEYLDRRLPFEKNIRWRLITQLLGGWTIVKTIMFFSGMMLIHHVLPALAFSLNRLTLVTISMAIFLANVVISLGFIARQLFDRWQENAVRAAKLEKEKTQVQYDNLRNQLNPHFLFNSLSSLDSLIEDDPVLARQFLRQLSRVFRYVLQHKDKGVVSLEVEIDFINIYIALLKTRFDGAFNVVFDIAETAIDQGVVPVTLQVLLENAIKHNVISETHPLTISIAASENYLTVENKIQRKGRVETSNGEGLKNLVNLYGFLSQEPVEIIDNSRQFAVKIPLLARVSEGKKSLIG